jgi:hypothetical protein
MKQLKLTLCLAGAVGLLGCASAFSKVTPGMSAAQVNATMGTGPSTVTNYDESYAAWYYGDDQCLLMQNGQVVGKDESRRQNAAYTPIGTVQSVTKAQCAPPGAAGAASTETTIHTPMGGFQVSDPK